MQATPAEHKMWADNSADSGNHFVFIKVFTFRLLVIWFVLRGECVVVG